MSIRGGHQTVRDAVVRARVNSTTKHDVEDVLRHLGITMSEAISLYLSQIQLYNGIPFKIKIPNKETLRAMEETEKGIGLMESDNLEDFLIKTGIKDVKNKAQKTFEKDVKRAKKRGKLLIKLEVVTTALIMQQPLNLKYKDHPLIGNFKGYRECHIEPDWLLIYKIENDTIIFERTGTHADLFDK